ncbi:MAG: hypothetical protein ACK41W_17340, partial [Cyanobacteriota bacterium]
MRAWCDPLHRAARLEADRGFGDLQGRADTFSGFVCRTLSQPPEGLNSEDQRRLETLRQGFSRYDQLSAASRQRLVCQLRQG